MLGELLETEWLTDITKLRDDADIYILSVKDSVLCDLISEVCKGREDKLFLHTAGSMPMSCFEGEGAALWRILSYADVLEGKGCQF